MKFLEIRKLIEEEGGYLNFTNTLQRMQFPPTNVKWYINICGDTQKIWKQIKRDGYAVIFFSIHNVNNDKDVRHIVNKIFLHLNPIWNNNSFQCSFTLEFMYNNSLHICENCDKFFKHKSGLIKHRCI